MKMNSGHWWSEHSIANLVWQVHLICGMISGGGLLKKADGSKRFGRHAFCRNGFEDRCFEITVLTWIAVDGFKDVIASAIFDRSLHGNGDGAKHIAHHVPRQKCKEQYKKNGRNVFSICQLIQYTNLLPLIVNCKLSITNC